MGTCMGFRNTLENLHERNNEGANEHKKLQHINMKLAANVAVKTRINKLTLFE